jgi:hypothetical protein
MDHGMAITLHAAERYWHGSLSEAEREQFEEHFFGCAECAEEVRWEKLFIEHARAELEKSAEVAHPEPQFFDVYQAPWDEPVEIYREAGMFAVSLDIPADQRFYSYTVEVDDRLIGSLAAPREARAPLHLAVPIYGIPEGEHQLTVRGARAAEIIRCLFRII